MQGDGCTFTGLGFDAHRPTVHCHDGPDNSQAQPGAVGVGRTSLIDAVEAVEHFWEMLRRNATAVITDTETTLSALGEGATTSLICPPEGV
jgi:hypothetical protein